MQHLYSVQSSANTNTSATNIPAANTFEFGYLLKELNLFETSGVRTPNLDMLPYSQHKQTVKKFFL
jgi:hypothetical protein